MADARVDKGTDVAAPRMPTVLVVEDELFVRIALADYLQECGFKVFEAYNADEAIAALEFNKLAIDLVFSDIQMPGSTDGFGLAHWIHTNLPGMPVLLTSGDKTKVETAKQLHEAEPFLEKPYDLDTAVAQIRSAIADSKAA